MKLTPNFYRDRVCLNVLAGSKDNASEIYEAAEGGRTLQKLSGRRQRGSRYA